MSILLASIRLERESIVRSVARTASPPQHPGWKALQQKLMACSSPSEIILGVLAAPLIV